MDYIIKILRTLFFHIDKVVYEGIGNVYDLLLSIARTSIFNSGTIEGFYKKIYALIGIFMLFKISFSLITYILNPDDFSDKEKGFASIIKRVIMSLVMLVLVPYGFQEAYELQTIILEDNTLAALIFEGVDNDEEATYKIDTAGDKIKFILMYTFFQPNYNEIYESSGDAGVSACAVTYQHESNGAIHAENGVFVLNNDCFGKFEPSTMEYSTESGSLPPYWKGNEDLYQTYVQGIARQNFYLMFKHDIAMLQVDKSEIYLVDYMAPLSTAVGIAVLWVLLLFCIDVAVRSVKLGFYELIAPIPILSYIDPKTKDGMLSKWFKQVSTTYLSLFMRLLALYLAIFIIYSVAQNGIADVVTGERITDWWVIIFVIIGVLMFAKQLPKILEETLGIKGTGDFTLNPLKKLEDGMLGGKAIKKTAGTAAAMGLAGTAAFGSNLIGGLVNNKGAGKLKAFGSAFAGAGSAMGRAAWGGAKGEKFGKNWASSYGAAMAAKQSRADRRDAGVGWGEMMGSKIQQKMGIHTAGEVAQSKIEDLDKITKLKDQATTIADKSDPTVKRLLKEMESLKGLDPTSLVNKDSYYHENPETGQRVFDNDGYRAAVEDAVKKHGEMVKRKDTEIDDARAAYFQTASTDPDSAISGIFGQMNDLMRKYSSEINAGFEHTGAKDPSDPENKKYYTTETITAANIKEAGTAAIRAKQDYEQSAGAVHSQVVDKYGAKKGQK